MFKLHQKIEDIVNDKTLNITFVFVVFEIVRVEDSQSWQIFWFNEKLLSQTSLKADFKSTVSEQKLTTQFFSSLFESFENPCFGRICK
jgi:hypothetical protein